MSPGQGARHRHSSRVLIQVRWIERYKHVEKCSSDVYWSVLLSDNAVSWVVIAGPPNDRVGLALDDRIGVITRSNRVTRKVD